MKKLTTLFIFLLAGYSYSQDAIDIGTPTDSPFNLGGDIQGTIQNSVNEVTGKVTFSASLASISASSVSFGVNLTYSGQATFKNGQETNKYNPTSVAGVGWSLSVPKIVVDNKNTGTRDDDVFYLLDGATSTKLICVDKVSTAQWIFEMEKYAPWKITYNPNNETWTVVKENGLIYLFGNGTSIERTSTWGNWIGSSNQTPTGSQGLVWNIARIVDQWNNYVDFAYESVLGSQNNTQTAHQHTEAIYLKEIISSNGAKIQLTYDDKNSDEYYEPHIEILEPDAYQERYEKKYLQSVSSYNNENVLVATNAIGYTLKGAGLNKKRYLTSLTQTSYNNGLNETLPAQVFEYYHTGFFASDTDIFAGGLKKITYPAGGSVTYNYKNKLLFNNTANRYEDVPFSVSSLYQYHSMCVKDNYGLFVYRTIDTVSGDKYRFKFFRVWWNGDKWEWNEFTFPHLIPDYTTLTLKDFYVVLKNDFYGFVYDKGTTADMYLFHLNNDGRTWHSYTSSNRSIGSGTPRFVSSNEFVGLQNHRDGQLYTYVWNGTSWNYKLISQGSGQYYIAAANNYIISLDEDGGKDMIINGVTSNINYTDNYYLHYLDAEKKWQTKSWSAAADPYVSDTQSPSYFHGDNSIIGFMADYNPEFFLRWDTNYNLTNVDNNLLGSYSDTFPMTPVANSMFTISHNFYKYPQKSARFNGVNWSISSLPSSATYYGKLNFGEDVVLFQEHPMYGDAVGYHLYNPNDNGWEYNVLNNYFWHMSNSKTSSINREFTIAGNKIYGRSNQGIPFSRFYEIGSLEYNNNFTYSDGLSHAFVKEVETIDNGGSASSTLKKGSYFYLDKKTGLLANINLGLKEHLSNYGGKLGGYTPFMSPSSIWLKSDAGNNAFDRHFYRIIDDKLNNEIYDIVVNYIDINDDNGNLKKVQYTYNKPKSTPDNSSTFYSEVITENKGVGTGNIGKIVKVFNDGSEDLTMVGLPLKVLTIDTNNNLIKKTTSTWQKYTKYISNGSNTIAKGYYIRPTKQKEELYFENSADITTETYTSYNSYGLKTGTTTTDSKGKSVKQDITYAYQQYTFVEDKNMLSFPYQTTTKINNQIVNVSQSKWVNDNNKVYINETWSGPSTSTLRLNSQISKVESTTGNVLENNNGKGLYNAVLFGYDNLYEVATVSNVTHQDLIDELDITYAQLQNLNTVSLKVELLKLYDKLPDSAISLSFYDDNGRVVSTINGRKEEAFVYYDTLGRQDYITDAQGNILEKKNYYFNN